MWPGDFQIWSLSENSFWNVDWPRSRTRPLLWTEHCDRGASGQVWCHLPWRPHSRNCLPRGAFPDHTLLEIFPPLCGPACYQKQQGGLPQGDGLTWLLGWTHQPANASAELEDQSKVPWKHVSVFWTVINISEEMIFCLQRLEGMEGRGQGSHRAWSWQAALPTSQVQGKVPLFSILSAAATEISTLQEEELLFVASSATEFIVGEWIT